jgi:D-3-phosphoglycerate dehydrogenase
VLIAYRQTALDADFFATVPGLLAAVRCAVDIRTIDVAAASREGVLVTRASPGFGPSVAEWVMGVMIDLSRHITEATVAYRQGQTVEPRMGLELRGACVGIIGFGEIGRHVARLAQAFGMNVCVYDPHVVPQDLAVESVDWRELLARADHVVCLAPATPDTENLINAQALSLMKPMAFFINASRGQLVDEQALLHALDHGLLAGAALDVGRAADQMPSPELARHPRVIATPHVGGLTPQAIAHQALETVVQTTDILQGRMPHGAVNPAHAQRWLDRVSP